jgi:hypothetical protein
MQLDLFHDDPAERERVASRIAGAIFDFFWDRPAGFQWHADELLGHVEKLVGKIAPDSPNRILRQLKRQRQINYHVVNRSQSLYEFLDALHDEGKAEHGSDDAGGIQFQPGITTADFGNGNNCQPRTG